MDRNAISKHANFGQDEIKGSGVVNNNAIVVVSFSVCQLAMYGIIEEHFLFIGWKLEKKFLLQNKFISAFLFGLKYRQTLSMLSNIIYYIRQRRTHRLRTEDCSDFCLLNNRYSMMLEHARSRVIQFL